MTGSPARLPPDGGICCAWSRRLKADSKRGGLISREEPGGACEKRTAEKPVKEAPKPEEDPVAA